MLNEGLVLEVKISQAVLILHILQPRRMRKVFDVVCQRRWLMLHGQSKEIENGFQRVAKEGIHISQWRVCRRREDRGGSNHPRSPCNTSPRARDRGCYPWQNALPRSEFYCVC